MATWHEVATADQIVEGQAFAAEVGGNEIAIVRLGEDLFAIGNICPHQRDTLLSDGYLDGELIECPLHQSCFDVRTGKLLNAPAREDVPSYPVKTENNSVFVEL
jgi:nitrite reductase/ring-hydroxylating ferredoxin subunit